MAKIVVCGAGIVGLCTAAMLGSDGHDVTVLEADAAAPDGGPHDAWESWERKGVAQFRQPHNLLPRFRQIADVELPGLTDRLVAAGCTWVDFMAVPPPSMQNFEKRADDDKFRFVTGRRPVLESTMSAHAQEISGVTVRRGVTVAGLISGPAALAGVPHVAGVVLDDGERIPADLVVDATGRKSPSPDWLAGIGAKQPLVESDDCGFIYYTRYISGETQPQRFGPPLVPMGSISVLTIPGDNNTWSVTLFAATGDAPLKELRHNESFDRVVRAFPFQAHWLDGKPITDVLPMAGIVDRYRRFVVEGEPIATGFAAVGDAWACTNPSAGRGMSVGMVHAQLLRATVRENLGDPAAFAKAWDQQTETHVAPFYRNQIALDRVRFAEMQALREGRTPPAPDPNFVKLQTAAAYDQDVFRAMVEVGTCLALPQQVFARPGMAERLAEHGDKERFIFPGPDRAQLLELLAA
jgi:2-polyprenyl-6-methoxyphenol hydroxylase-like FAD-dependent oxidoreductase